MAYIARISLISLAISLAAQAMPAMAQADSKQAPEETSVAAETAPGEIIVTANKREQSLSDVGLSITAETGDTLIQRGITSPTDLEDRAGPDGTWCTDSDGHAEHRPRRVGLE